jgi:glyoxylase-like metal-dependent hydrolase (beta-lactamase superfamily II)
MATKIPFVRDIDFEYGAVDQVSPLIRRVIARNGGPFTYTGTGTYIVGKGQVAVVDPGPLIDDHIEALTAALAGETVSHILITHTHLDHSPAAAPLKDATSARTFGYGPHGQGKLETGIVIEEGGDQEFKPDVTVRHGDVIQGDGWTIDSVYTPGHTSNHMCFALREEKALFTGDHVMGWSTSVVGPPDGDMTAYMDSLKLLLTRDDANYWPTHGPAVRDPKPFVKAFIAHREEREEQIAACLVQGVTSIKDMVAAMYADVDKRLHPAAALSVFAHLLNMISTGRAQTDGTAALDAVYRSPD